MTPPFRSRNGCGGPDIDHRPENPPRENPIMLSRSIGLACALLFSTADIAAAAEGRGEELARKWCSSCHIVAPDQATGAEGVPSFAEIAATGSAASVGRFLFDPHPPMSGLALARTEIADLTAYILDQKP